MKILFSLLLLFLPTSAINGLTIGFFTDNYKPRISGTVTVTDLMYNAFTKLGHTVYIITPARPDAPQAPHIIHIPSIKLPIEKQANVYIASLPNITTMNTIQSLNLDIIHCITSFTTSFLGKSMAKKLNIPIVYTYSANLLASVKSLHIPLPSTLLKYLISMWCATCSAVLAPSTAIKKDLHTYGVKKRITVLPMGIDINSFEQANPAHIRTRYKVLPHEQLLLYVGRLVPEKNLSFLLKAFASYKKGCSLPTKLMLVGGGESQHELHQQATTLGIHHDVIFTGAVERAHLSHYYTAADLFVFTSCAETQGLVVLEAMNFGLPVVALQAQGVEDIVEHSISGLLAHHTQQDFVDQLAKALTNQQLYAHLRKGALERAQHFSPEKTAQKHLEIYSKAIRRKKNHVKRINVVPG